MGDIEHLKELVNKLVLENVQQKEDMNRLIAALADRPQQNQQGVVNQQPDPAVVRASALSRVALALRKSQKLKDFTYNEESNS